MMAYYRKEDKELGKIAIEAGYTVGEARLAVIEMLYAEKLPPRPIFILIQGGKA